MKVARYEHAGAVGTGLVEGDMLQPVAGDVLGALAGDTESTGEAIGLDAVRLLAPVERPPKFLAIGMNYADHVTELGREAPDFPVFFNKQSTCVVGPGDAIEVPSVSEMVDYEGELGIVIARRCRHVSAGDAPGVVAGFTVVNDVSVRDWQLRSPTMTLGKSFDTHGPLGPWVVSPDDVGDPHALALRTWVNDDLLQDASTAEMIYDCWAQIEVLSTVCTLEPGDVIATGTPAGVGLARRPPRWLRPGDVVRIEIETVGVLENPVVAEPDGVNSSSS